MENKKAKYDMEYAKKNIKRIPLDVQKEQYEIIKSAADSEGMKLNSFIKKAIDEKIASAKMDEDFNELGCFDNLKDAEQATGRVIM